ncbi:hypothetical protein KIW84_057663 [Lathyrus oleraceus]|uniref:Uncharacterized protein n=1 Tax=Pisum sativum TaxID=3888 RepID=A0A9D5AN77_PEA|nr:hypothetical protein KIW84_057663 [Pisum sativum]
MFYNLVLILGFKYKGNIRVFCLCRPLNKVEMSAGCTTFMDFDEAKDGCLGILITDSSAKKKHSNLIGFIHQKMIKLMFLLRHHLWTNIKRLEIKQSSEGYHHVPGVVETKVDNIYAMWNIPQTGSDAGSIKISIDGLNITHSARDEKQLMSPTRMTPSTSGLLHGKQYKYVNSPALCLSSSNIQKHVEEPSRLSVKLNSGNATPLVSLPSLTVNVVPVDSLDGVAVKQEFIQHSIIKPSNSTVSNSKLFDSTVVKSRTDVLLLRIAHRH